MMNSTRWDRFAELLAAALERAPEDRGAFLAAAEPDAELRAEVEEALRAEVEQQPLALELRLLADAEGSEPSGGEPPHSIGPYRIVGAIGRGGMGEVFLAERDEGGYARKVAIKRIRRGLESAEIRERFRLERQLLARLSHPGIARLLDGGIDEQGIPYLVLEYVEGHPITEACDARGLSVEARLHFLGEVCKAVASAHTQLVVHRDLKPSNILVSESGEVRLLDFGIAKLLDPETGAAAHPLTRTALRLATPEYASPEQLAGGAVTTATDIHALGLLLFELLTGRRPFRQHESTLAALEQALLHEEPPRPSAVALGLAGEPSSEVLQRARARGLTPQALARCLRGDLDTIVATALRKEPTRRYPSVELFAEDLRRHVAGLPVRARPDTLGYRSGKFLRRHRLGVAVAATLLLFILGSAGGALLQARAVARQRDAARAERDRADEISAFIVNLFSADPFADSGAANDRLSLREFLEGREDAVRQQLAGRPGMQGTLLTLLARLQGNLGRFERARALADEGLALTRREFGEESPQVALSLNTLATILHARGENEEAERLFRQALAIRERLYGELHPDVAESVNNLAVMLAEHNQPQDWEETERLERRGLDLRRRLFGDDHLETAQSLNALASFLIERNRPEDRAEAESLYREALAIRLGKLGEAHPNVATLRNNLAQLLLRSGRFEESEALFRQAIDGWTAALGPEHPRVSAGHFGLHKVLAARGDRTGAIAALERSLAIDEKTLPPDHPYLEESRKRLRELAGAAP